MRIVYYRKEISNTNECAYRPITGTNGLLLQAEVIDKWDRVVFRDDKHTYTIKKWAHVRKEDDGDPLLTNFDWGNIFKIRAIYNRQPFYEDLVRSRDDKMLYYLDDSNNVGEVLNLKTPIMIYTGWNNPFVRISSRNCFTWVSFIGADEDCYVLDSVGEVWFFI